MTEDNWPPEANQLIENQREYQRVLEEMVATLKKTAAKKNREIAKLAAEAAKAELTTRNQARELTRLRHRLDEQWKTLTSADSKI